MVELSSKTLRALLLVCALFSAAVLTACGPESPNSAPATPPAMSMPEQSGTEVRTAYGAYTNLTPPELHSMLNNKDFFLVDVHTPPEGRLPKTDARVVFDQVEQQIKTFPADKSAKIVVTCRSGHMSGIASETLTRLGYTNIYNLAGGMNAWKAAGYEIIPEGK